MNMSSRLLHGHCSLLFYVFSISSAFMLLDLGFCFFPFFQELSPCSLRVSACPGGPWVVNILVVSSATLLFLSNCVPETPASAAP